MENFIYFFTVSGFFIGLIFSVVNFTDPFYILFYTFLITLFFYLLIHLSVANFLDIKNLSKKLFDKAKYEEMSDYFVFELENRENKIDALVNIIENPNKDSKRVNSNGSQSKVAA